MPPVEEIDEFDDDVSHLYPLPPPSRRLQAAANSVVPPPSPSLVPPSPSLPPLLPIHWCWSVYSSSKKIKINGL
ncbi:hypothetical protein TIFTF001_032271 [Ficus carica]|uniref:Uncharacterized protein n=1 Tax=Ficus carica TaxID=3494 RepID=A0AA88J5K5_FICCA|nr:hypothetical protein TIFTF001_032271 [Ficus carica]